MPRDANGVYTLPSGNPVVTNTPISSLWANTTMADIRDALTNSLPRDGSAAMTGPIKFLDGSILGMSPVGGRKNYIVDPLLDQWVTLPSVNIPANTYSQSGPVMRTMTAGAGTATVTRAPIIGPFGVPFPSWGPASSVAQWNQTAVASAGNPPYWLSRIEDARALNNRSATYSVWLSVPSGTLTLTNIVASQNFGTGGSPSAGVTFSVPVNWVITTTMQRFSVRVDIPSISAKTFGTDLNSYLTIGLQFPGTALFNITVGPEQLEETPAAAPAAGWPTPIEYLGPVRNQLEVNRYAASGFNRFLGYSGQNGASFNAMGIFKTIMRAAPAITITPNNTVGFNNVAGSIVVNTVYGFSEERACTSTGNISFFDTWFADCRL